MSINAGILHAVNGWAGHNAFLDGLMIFTASTLIYVVFAVAAIVAARSIIIKKQWRPVILFVLTLGVTYIGMQLVSQLYVNNRPFVDYELTQLIAHEAGRSFVSNHSGAAFAMAVGVFLFFGRRLGVILLVAAALIGFARIFVGVHYPIDIIGSMLVAFAAGALIWGVDYWLRRRKDAKQSGDSPQTA